MAIASFYGYSVTFTTMLLFFTVDGQCCYQLKDLVWADDGLVQLQGPKGHHGRKEERV